MAKVDPGFPEAGVASPLHWVAWSSVPDLSWVLGFGAADLLLQKRNLGPCLTLINHDSPYPCERLVGLSGSLDSRGHLNRSACWPGHGVRQRGRGKLLNSNGNLPELSCHMSWPKKVQGLGVDPCPRRQPSEWSRFRARK